MRRPTLEEKRYGPGFRPEPYRKAAQTTNICAVEGCKDAPYGSAELFVDDQPPGVDWYTRLLREIPERTWTRLIFCMNHLAEVIQRGEDMQTNPDLWAPGRGNPPVLPRPPKLLG